jgi:hypothetical protein
VQKVLNSLPVAATGMGRPLVVICSYTTFRLNQDAFYKKGFHMVICDEV